MEKRMKIRNKVGKKIYLVVENEKRSWLGKNICKGLQGIEILSFNIV